MIRSASKSDPSSRLVLLAVGTFVLGVDSFVLAGLLPDVAHDLHVSLARAGQLTTAFALAYAIGSPLIATATGRLDRRVVLGGGMAVFLLGMVGQALGPTYATVLAGRILAALGAAAFQANAYAVAGFLSPPERRARSLAMVGAGTSLATVIGVPLGVLLGQQIGWRAALWAITVAAAVAGALCLTLPGIRLPTASLRERVGVFTSPRMLLLLCGTALQLVPLYAVISYVAPVIGAKGQTDTPVLVALVVFGAALFLGNRLVGHLADRWGGLRVITVGLTVSALALVALWILRLDLVPAIAALAVLGLVGSFQITPQQTRVFAAGGTAATVALGLNGSMIYVGSGGGAALGGGVVATAGAAAVPLVAAGAAVVALAFLWATAPERRPVHDAGQEARTVRAPEPDRASVREGDGGEADVVG